MKRVLLAAAVLAGTVSSAAFAQDGEQRWLRIHNETSVSLCEVYISHVGTRKWQSDRIGSCISAGRYRTVDPGWQQGYCKMDMKFVFADGDEVVENDFNICEYTDFYINE